MREDWVECSLSDVVTIQTGKYDANHATSNGKYRFYTCAFEYLKCNTNRFSGNSIILPGNGANVGEVFYYEGEFDAYQRTYVLNESKLNAKYIYYHLKGFWKTKNLDKQFGTATNYIRIGNFTDYSITFPPLPEQRAIVEKIEKLFSDLDNGIANLEKAQAQLKVYRQAVLKKAFEGELTKEWRAKQTDLPSAEELLENIKAERENHYQQQLSDWEEEVKAWEGNGKEGKKPRKPRKGKEVESFTDSELTKLNGLPKSWQWVKLGEIFQVFVGSTPSRKSKEYWENGGINWVSSGEVSFNRIKETKEKITVIGLENSSTTVHPPGTVMLAMIGEGKTRGQAAILNTNACHNQNTAAIRVSEIGFFPELLFHYLFLKYERNRRIGSGNNQKALNQSRIMDFDYPLCSLEEQHQIVQEIESRLSVCDQVEKDIAESLEKAEALRQSILKKAFEGKLLTEAELEACRQQPDWEPAEKLLERIKSEKKIQYENR